jgi:hypothetical protein
VPADGGVGAYVCGDRRVIYARDAARAVVQSTVTRCPPASPQSVEPGAGAQQRLDGFLVDALGWLLQLLGVTGRSARTSSAEARSRSVTILHHPTRVDWPALGATTDL